MLEFVLEACNVLAFLVVCGKARAAMCGDFGCQWGGCALVNNLLMLEKRGMIELVNRKGESSF